MKNKTKKEKEFGEESGVMGKKKEKKRTFIDFFSQETHVWSGTHDECGSEHFQSFPCSNVNQTLKGVNTFRKGKE